jgi:putative transposase
MDERFPQRKTPIHFPAVSSHNRSNIIFLTVCTEKRKPILAYEDIHQLLIASWQTAGAWIAGRYVIMPDHVHLFCAPSSIEPTSVQKWVQFWKAHVSFRWPRTEEQPIWQKSCWETQLRRGENYENKWNYVCQNPVRHGLAKQIENWPYCGELNKLEWHD